MAPRKAYRLTSADRPIHVHLHMLFNEHRIVGWSVAGHNAWWLEEAEGDLQVKTFDEIRSYLLDVDPSRCGWATKQIRTTPRALLVDLVGRLSKIVADVDPELADEAQRALEAA